MSDQRLFISHASEDAAVADRIVAYLETHGVPCWISSRDIPPRAIYADAITEAVQACSACAVLVSKDSNVSKAVKRELELASHYDKAFIPIRIDGSEPASGVDYYLQNTQWMDYKRDGDNALDRIAGHFQGSTAPPPQDGATNISRSMRIGGAALTIALLCFGGWFAWRQFTPQHEPRHDVSINAETVAPLLGAYSWAGIQCGDGPTITYDAGALIFTMAGTPTFRHVILNASAGGDGPYSLHLLTRVAAPTEAEGQVYAIGLNGDELTLSIDTRDDVWTKCAP